MQSRQNLVRFPLWMFLNQPLFDRHRKLVLNPRYFWYLYRIELLERCLMKKVTSNDASNDPRRD